MISFKIAIAIVFLVIIYIASLSFSTRHDRIKSAGERQLAPCPDRPNCVLSQATKKPHAIEAFTLLENNETISWKKLIAAIQKSGGEILIDDGHYCHAVFTSTVFRFKDDLEAVLNNDKIDIRSASRAGKSDLGKNRERVEKIRLLYKTIKEA